MWRALKLKRSLRAPKKKGIKSVIMYYEEIAKDFLAFVGFKGRFSLVKVMIGMVAGILTGLVTLLCRAHFENSSIHFTEPVILLVLFFTRLEIWGVILIVPIIEEIVFRGVFINRFMII